MRFLKQSLLTGLFLLLGACGGGGSSPQSTADKINSASPATITTSNAQKLSIAATESARQAVLSQNVNFLGQKTSPSQFDPEAFSEKLVAQVSQASDFGIACDSGSYTTSGFSANSENGSITFNNCALVGAGDLAPGSVVNGTISISSADTSFSLEFINFSVTYNGTTESINFSMSCENLNNTINCTTTSSITGIDGRTYLIGEITVTSNLDSTYNVTAVVVDPEFGRININATSVIFDCAAPYAGRPGNGSITFSSNGNTASIVFDSCSSYIVTLDNVSTSYTW